MYKKKVEEKPMIEEDTKRSPKATKKKKTKREVTVTSTGPHWEKKEVLEAQKEIQRVKKAAAEQKFERRVLSEIFDKLKEDEGIEEDELKEQIKERMNNKKKQSVADLSQAAQNILEKSAANTIMAMRQEYLADEYSAELDSFGKRIFYKKSAEKEQEYVNDGDGQQRNEMMEKFAASRNGAFKVEDVINFFKGADETKLKTVCRELKMGVYDDLFICAQSRPTGIYTFVIKGSK